VLPVSIGVLLLIAGHLTAMQRAEMPRSRRRIRTINGVVMLFATPLIAYAFGIAHEGNAGTFVAAWSGVTVLMGVILVMAVIDMLNNLRLHRERLRRIRGDAVQTLRAEVASRSRGRPSLADGYDPGDADGPDRA